MSQTELEHLKSMANQIAANAPTSEPQAAGAFVANHIRRFWAPSMCQQLLDYAVEHKASLSPVLQCAVEQLGETPSPSPH